MTLFRYFIAVFVCFVLHIT